MNFSTFYLKKSLHNKIQVVFYLFIERVFTVFLFFFFCPVKSYCVFWFIFHNFLCKIESKMKNSLLDLNRFCLNTESLLKHSCCYIFCKKKKNDFVFPRHFSGFYRAFEFELCWKYSSYESYFAKHFTSKYFPNLFFFFFFLARRQILTFFLEQKEKKFRDETNKKYITIIIHFFVRENFQLKSFLTFLRKFFALLDDNFSSLKNCWVFFRWSLTPVWLAYCFLRFIK